MVTAVFRRFAALAAVLILSACGGGDQEVKKEDPTAVFAQSLASMPADIKTSPLLEKAVKAPVAKPATSAVAESSLRSASAIPQSAVTTLVFKLSEGGTTASSSLSATVATVPTTDQFLNWVANIAVPEFFPGEYQNLPLEGYVLRYYPTDEAYIAVRADGEVFVLLLKWFTDIKPLGNVFDYRCKVDAEMCRPRVLASGVFPANGAVDVPAKGTTIKVPLNQGVPCPPAPIVGTFGVIQGTLYCVSTKTSAEITIVPANDLPGGPITATLSGLSGVTGLVMPNFTWSFTVKKPPLPPMMRIYTANAGDVEEGTKVSSVLDVVTGNVTQIGFPILPGFMDIRRVVIDPVEGKVFYGALATDMLYSTNLENNEVLPSIMIDEVFAVKHTIIGLALAGTDVCMAFARPFIVDYPRQNQLECRNTRDPKLVTFKSQSYHLGDATMMTTLLKSLSFGNEKRLYALNATKGAYYIGVLEDGGLREDFYPNTVGEVVVIDAVTKAVIKKIQVGSAPQGIDQDSVTGDLYVTNGGDNTVTGNCTTG